MQNSRYSYKAYHSRNKESNCGNTEYLPKNIRIMHYAEVLLMHAESAFQLGKTGDATPDLTTVRTRAGLAATTPTLANIWRERRVELAMEHDRFFDLVRQASVQLGIIIPAFALHGKTFVNRKNEVFTIAQA